MSSRVSVHVYTKVNKTGLLLSLNLNKAYVIFCFHFNKEISRTIFHMVHPMGIALSSDWSVSCLIIVRL